MSLEDEMNKDPSQQRVQELFTYDSETGLFCWKNNSGRYGRIKAGTPAGCVCTGGYMQVRVDGNLRMLHRLAWIYSNGPVTTEMVDHIDGNRLNNRLSNLRQATRSMNAQNIRRANSLSKHGVLGISPGHKGWKASVSVNNKQRYLGVFPTQELAHAAYLAAKRELHEGCTI